MLVMPFVVTYVCLYWRLWFILLIWHFYSVIYALLVFQVCGMKQLTF